MNLSNHTPTTVGKYLVSPLTKALECGAFGCSVSIRSGSGSGTTDRVHRLTQRFTDRIAAADFARAQGIAWIGELPGHARAS